MCWEAPSRKRLHGYGKRYRSLLGRQTGTPPGTVQPPTTPLVVPANRAVQWGANRYHVQSQVIDRWLVCTEFSDHMAGSGRL